ncbi:MAG: serine/threonine protein kinase [Planctomycetales bacterium]|nr:serine/threonine protein kinase [Planctomycetales bacterium]
MSATRDPWDWLTDQLEAFLTAWEEHESSGPPAIATYAQAVLEAGDLNAEEAGDLQRTLLAELIKADIEYRLLHSVAPPLEDYLSAHASLRELPVDLLHEDYHLRRRAGEEVSVEDYCERFPGQAEDFRRLLGLDLPEATTTLYASKRPPLFQLGDLVADEFRLLAMLGEGSFARVYLARQESISRLVALKITANRGHEAQTIVKLDHPNIIRVVDQRDVPVENMRLLYMEYAPGGTLHEVVRRVQATEPRTGDLLAESVRESMERGGLEASFPATLREAAWPRIVCDLGIQLALALDYAHSQGVLHRDIKPANVLLGANARPKLADFNTSFDSQLEGVAPAAYFGGSLAYMSPEQLRACNIRCNERADSLDARSDLYSLAILLWELLHGQRPYHDAAPTGDWSTLLSEMAQRRESGAPRGASGGDPLSRDLQKVLAKCLEPDRERRFGSGAVLARELQLCLNPDARRLVALEHGRLGRFALARPLLALLIVVVAPNLLAAGLNFAFNWNWVWENARDATRPFLFIQGVINVVAFSLGLLWVARRFRPTTRTVEQRVRGERVPPERLQQARRLALEAGPYSAWIGVSLWGVAGVVYPLALHLKVGTFPWNGYPVFIVDLITCGLIAGSYPFFLGSLLAAEVFFPVLLDLADIPHDEAAPLQRLSRQTGLYLQIAAGVPMVTMLLLIPLVFSSPEAKDVYQPALIGLLIAGIFGLFGTWKAHLRLQRILDALCYVVRPITL